MNETRQLVNKLKTAVNEDDKCRAFKDFIDNINQKYNIENNDDIMSEPEYYASNGLSPIGAMKQGLVSHEQYKGFLIGNIIKYVVRAGKKDDAIQDLEKAKDYINFYIELIQEGEQEL